MRTLVVEIPLPPRKCSPNASRAGAWRSKSEARKSYRADVLATVNRALRERFGSLPREPLFAKVEIDTEWFTASNPAKNPKTKRSLPDGLFRPHDGDNANASLKGAMDALVEARIVAKDTATFLRLNAPTILSAKESAGRRAVVLTMVDWDGQRSQPKVHRATAKGRLSEVVQVPMDPDVLARAKRHGAATNRSLPGMVEAGLTLIMAQEADLFERYADKASQDANGECAPSATEGRDARRVGGAL